MITPLLNIILQLENHQSRLLIKKKVAFVRLSNNYTAILHIPILYLFNGGSLLLFFSNKPYSFILILILVFVFQMQFPSVPEKQRRRPRNLQQVKDKATASALETAAFHGTALPRSPAQEAATLPAAAAAGGGVRQAEQRPPREEANIGLGRADNGDDANAAAPEGVIRRAWQGRRTMFVAIERQRRGGVAARGDDEAGRKPPQPEEEVEKEAR